MGEKRPGIVVLCAETVFSGTWLDLGAGDGRYADELMRRCDRVVALDADESALSKLWHRTPERDRERLQLIVHTSWSQSPWPTSRWTECYV